MKYVTRTDLPDLQSYLGYLKEIWGSHRVTNDGDLVRLLEERTAQYLGVSDILLVSSGTSALQLALKAFGLSGQVITTPFTFAATTNSLIWEGIEPVFADIDPETFCIDPDDVERMITPKTSAILAVHVFGNPCQVEVLEELAARNDVKLIYDAASAFGVTYKDRPLVDFGDAAILSSHATKVFSTAEGGAIACSDNGIFEDLKLMRNHGIKSEKTVLLPGINAKMSEFHAALGLCNLEGLDERIGMRKVRHERYMEILGACSRVRFQKITASRYNYSMLPIILNSKGDRDRTSAELQKAGYVPRTYFEPLACDFDYFTDKGSNRAVGGELTVARKVSETVLCLPLYPDLELSAVDEVAGIVKRSA